VLTQGSLIIRADRIVVRQDSDGFYTASRRQSGDLPPQTGRERRLHRRGSSEDRIRQQARSRRILPTAPGCAATGGDDIRGDTISYDAKTERFGVKSAGTESGTERVRATIMPKKPRRRRARPFRHGPARLVPRAFRTGRDSMSQLQVHGLKKHYGSRVVVKERVARSYRAARSWGCSGPNGAGKTTCFY